jgi:phospholipid transport system substrate-binding protein
LYGVIDEVLLPVFDRRYAGHLVLGKHWKPATAEQRDRFIAAFYAFLLKTYAKGMLEFDQDNMRVLAAEDSSKENRARVKTELKLGDGSTVPVNYSLRRSSAGWKVYDVRIEGVSYVQNYRNQFAAEISALGIDAVIARLEDEAKFGANADT